MENLFENPLLPVLLIIFIGALIRAALGFGDALVAMPLLALVAPIGIASPLVAFLSLLIGVIMLVMNWHNVDFRSAWRLILASMVGIPLGLYFLKSAPEALIKGALGVVLIVFGGYSLVGPKLPVYRAGWLTWLLGILAGVLGGAYNANGPLVIIYGRLAGWEPDRFRATLQSCFVPVATFIFIGHGLSGSWTPDVLTLYAWSLPVIIGALLLGTWLSRKIPPGAFDRLVYGAIIGMGVLMFI